MTIPVNCSSGFSWDGKPFWPEIRIYASQKSFNIHSTEKIWKSIIRQYYKYALHICSIFTQNCLVSSWGPGCKNGYHLSLFFSALESSFFLKTNLPPVAARSHPRWHPHREHDVHDWFPTHTTTLDFPSRSLDQHCRSVILWSCHAVSSRVIFQWTVMTPRPSQCGPIHPLVTNHEAIGAMTCGLGILTYHCHGFFNHCYGWWTMMQTCSNRLILKETMQGCTASWCIRKKWANYIGNYPHGAVNTSHLVEEQLAVAGMFSTS